MAVDSRGWLAARLGSSRRSSSARDDGATDDSLEMLVMPLHKAKGH